MCLSICTYLLIRYMFRHFPHFLIVLFVLYYCVLIVLSKFWTDVLCQMYILIYFLPDISLPFYSFKSVFHRKKKFNFNKVQLFKVFFHGSYLGVVAENSSVQGHIDFSPIFFSKSFIILHFELIFCISYKICIYVLWR